MNKLTKFAILTVLTLTAGLALAVQQLDLNVSPRLEALISGLVIGPRSSLTSDTTINANRITRSVGGSVTVDFDGGTLGCVDIAFGLPGVRASDTCDVGVPASGGAANNSFTCFVSDAGEVTVRDCHGGVASDPASAAYSVRTFSSISN